MEFQAEAQIVCWRDIPAQIVVRQGRKRAARPLSTRFEKAIDRCAMKVGARDTDTYLAQWRRRSAGAVSGDLEKAAEALAQETEARFDKALLARLIDNDGWSVGE